MPTDLKSMLTAADSHDALAGIEHRDLPQAEPRDYELTEIAADVWKVLKHLYDIETSSHGDSVAHSRIRIALLEVREAATSAAACKAWNRAVELLK